MKKFFFLACAAVVFAACSDDDAPRETPFDGEIVSFESDEHLLDAMTGSDVQLGAVTMSLMGIGNYTYEKVFCAKEYAVGTDFDGMLFATADQNLIFNSYYSAFYDGWGGIALSQLSDRSAAEPSSTQQFSVWADGGANGTDTFAVFYDSNTPTESYPEYMSQSGYPTIDLIEPRIVDHLYIANSTWVYNFFKGEETDSFQVKITGSLGGRQTGSVTETLVSGKSKLNGWRKVDLTKLGSVDQLVFKVVGVDVTKDPTYFCIDEIALVK